LRVLALALAFACCAQLRAQEELAYAGRVVPPMVGPELPGADAEAAKKLPEDKPKREWDRAMPFLAQRVIDQGIDLPNPYSIGLSAYFGREDRTLSSLAVGFNGAPLQDLGFVHFDRARVDYTSVQLQAGTWVFPFLNAYLIAGKTQGTGKIDIRVPGRDLMQFLGVPGCNLGPLLRPELCDRTLSGTAPANYHGTTYGLGLTAAGAYKELFFALPVTYVISDVSMSDTKGKTWNVSPRAGWNHKLGDGGTLTLYGGATWLSSKLKITGTFDFDTAGTVLGRNTGMSYSIDVKPKDNWNYLVGASWTIDRNWSLLLETGFGGSRQDLLLAGFLHF